MADRNGATGILFNRPPRLYESLPTDEVRIPAPSPMPSPPSPLAWWTIALPIAGTLIWIIAGAVTGSSGILLTSPVIFFSYGATVLTYFSQKKKYERALQERANTYEKAIAGIRKQLEELHQKQREIRNRKAPNLNQALAWAEHRHRRLWERGIQDEDFLALRIGIGSLPSTVPVKLPSQVEDTLEPDPLLQMAVQLRDAFVTVDDVPIEVPIPKVGSLGITGPRGLTEPFARALVAHLAVHHSPDEVKVAFIGSPERREEWSWLGQLPHTWLDEPVRIGEETEISRLLAFEPEETRALAQHLYETLNRRESQVQLLQARGQQTSFPTPFLLILVDDLAQVEQEAMMAPLLLQGPRIGAAAIFLTEREEDVPRRCGAVTRVTSESELTYVEAAPDGTTHICRPDLLTRETASRLAEAMFLLRPRGSGGPGELPAEVHLLDLYHVERPEDLDVLGYWNNARADKVPIDKGVQAPIGITRGRRALVFDLHERGHGPHGLIAGTTGSGKSELLQTIITSLSIQYSPSELNFVLVDYKGGGAMNVFENLPHTVGLVTDLHGGLAARALIALRSELRFREELLARHSVTHIDDYQRLPVKEPLPHLVIIIDEFAELALEQPDFMSELISVVRRGRSLGVHLILATQRPAGVVKGDIWSNSKFRICLRVETPEDSQEVLRRPEAASLFLPGRAYFQVGNNEIFELFQVARVGGSYLPPEVKAREEKAGIWVVTPGGKRELIAEVAGEETPTSPPLHKPPTLAKAIVDHICAQVEKSPGMKEILAKRRKPWPPPLPTELHLPDLRAEVCEEGWNGSGWQPARRWVDPVVGLLDDPANQQQEPLVLDLGEKGHVLICGSPGSGKSTLLRTLILDLAWAHSPLDLHLYILDMGGRALELFKDLPHVAGNVILPGERERLRRLRRRLALEIDRRKELLKGDNLKAHRDRHPDSVPPAIVLVVDNFAELREEIELLEVLEDIAREGAAYGMHLVLGADHPNAVPARISGNIRLRLALQMTQSGDYSLVVGRTGGLVPEPVPGRGLVKGTPVCEFQTALPVEASPEEQTQGLTAIVKAMAKAWEGQPTSEHIGVLRSRIPLSEVMTTWQPQGGLAVPIGLGDETLQPVTVDLKNDGPHFLVTGPPQSGKTTALYTWLHALSQNLPAEEVQFFLFDTFRRSLAPLRNLPHTHGYAISEDEQAAALENLERLLQARRAGQGEREPHLVVVIDDGEFIPEAIKNKAAELARLYHPFGLHVILAGAVAEMTTGYDPLRKQVKANRSGLLLGSNELQDAQVLNLTIPPSQRGRTMPAGRGYLMRRGRARIVQVALPESVDRE
ncbi:MAG TPA: type VII secretion protein EssC [Anaerolineae bacterium]|nr:type VII secretion protein EssC [Anaerolineae bacterium]